MVVQSWAQASAYILATGQEVMPMGGFSGTVPEPPLAQVQHLIRTGQHRFFLLGGSGAAGGGSGSTAQQVTRWAGQACAAVPAKDYGGSAGGTAGPGAAGTAGLGGIGGNALTGEVLYRCGSGS